MLFPLLPARLHGWLDEIATLSYLVAALGGGFSGPVLWLLLCGALFHFTNTRLTDYPQGQLKLYGLRAHATIELLEGLVMLAGAALLAQQTGWQQALLLVFGVSQLSAALGADTRTPV